MNENNLTLVRLHMNSFVTIWWLFKSACDSYESSKLNQSHVLVVNNVAGADPASDWDGGKVQKWNSHQ